MKGNWYFSKLLIIKNSGIGVQNLRAYNEKCAHKLSSFF